MYFPLQKTRNTTCLETFSQESLAKKGKKYRKVLSSLRKQAQKNNKQRLRKKTSKLVLGVFESTKNKQRKSLRQAAFIFMQILKSCAFYSRILQFDVFEALAAFSFVILKAGEKQD